MYVVVALDTGLVVVLLYTDYAVVVPDTGYVVVVLDKNMRLLYWYGECGCCTGYRYVVVVLGT